MTRDIAIKQLKGSMEVALKDGIPMLKASVSSEFLITLPQALPADFTLEFDLVPKACCAPQDLSFEGTPLINQGAGSAHVLWDSDGIRLSHPTRPDRQRRRPDRRQGGGL